MVFDDCSGSHWQTHVAALLTGGPDDAWGAWVYKRGYDVGRNSCTPHVSPESRHRRVCLTAPSCVAGLAARSESCGESRTLISRRDRGGVHPEGAPDVAVRIGEVAAVHEAVVLHGVNVRRPAMLRRGFVDGIDGRATLEVQRQRHLAGRLGANRPIGETPPFVVRQQHHENCLAPDHAGSGRIGEVRVILEAEGRIKGHRFREIGHGQVHKNHLIHSDISMCR